jgi:hypothetical protein
MPATVAQGHLITVHIANETYLCTQRNVFTGVVSGNCDHLKRGA